MISHKEVMVSQKIYMYACDFCDYKTEGTSFRRQPVHTCQFCKKDACPTCRVFYTENDWEDYPRGTYVCKQCKPEADVAWALALETAGRYDSMEEVFVRLYTELALEKEMKRVADALMSSQVELDADAKRVLYANKRELYYMTESEQDVMHRALRKSADIVKE